MKSAFILTLLLLAGCSSTSHVLVGTPRPPIDPSQVQVFLQAPATYEAIAMLEADSNGTIHATGQGKMNAVMKRLKAEAANLGANGIVMGGIGQMASGSIGSATATRTGHSTATGFGTSHNVFIKTGQALAIYVPAP